MTRRLAGLAPPALWFGLGALWIAQPPVRTPEPTPKDAPRLEVTPTRPVPGEPPIWTRTPGTEDPVPPVKTPGTMPTREPLEGRLARLR